MIQLSRRQGEAVCRLTDQWVRWTERRGSHWRLTANGVAEAESFGSVATVNQGTDQ